MDEKSSINFIDLTILKIDNKHFAVCCEPTDRDITIHNCSLQLYQQKMQQLYDSLINLT